MSNDVSLFCNMQQNGYKGGIMKQTLLGATVPTLALAALTVAAASQELPLRPLGEITLPGNPTRLDYQTIDPQRHLLFIAHLGDSAVVVLDTRTRAVIKTISGVSKVHGVLAIPSLGRVYASATGTNEIVAIDESSLAIMARAPGGVYPDGMAFDPQNRKLFVSDEHGQTETVIDVNSNRRVATISLGGDVGNTQYDPISRHIFVNVQTLGKLIEIDPSKDSIVGRTSLPGSACVGNHGLLIDTEMRRAFIACEKSATLVLLDMRTMRVGESWQIGDDPDVLALDPTTRWLFIAAESGVVSVFSDRSRVTRVAQGFLAPAAHTVAVDPTTHLVYFPLEDIGGKPVVRIMQQP